MATKIATTTGKVYNTGANVPGPNKHISNLHDKKIKANQDAINYKVRHIELDQFSLILSNDNIEQLTSDLALQKSVILHQDKPNEVATIITAKNYEEAYNIARDIIAAIYKRRRINEIDSN